MLNFRFIFISILFTFAVNKQAFANDEGRIMPPIQFSTMEALDELEEEAFAYGRGSYDPDFMASVSMRAAILQSLLEMAAELLRKFPPEDFDYVSLGRSGVGLAIAMEAQLDYSGQHAKVLELPISGMRDGHFEVRWYEDTFREHFQRHLSPLRRHPSRKVLVFDYISGGGTLRNFARILQLAQKEGWLPEEVHILGISEDGSRGFRGVGYDIHNSSRPLIQPERLHLLELPRPLGRSFKYCAFKDFAEYKPWYFRNDNFEACALGARSAKVKEPRYRPAKCSNTILSFDTLIDKLSGTKTRKDFREALDRVHFRFENEIHSHLTEQNCEQTLMN